MKQLTGEAIREGLATEFMGQAISTYLSTTSTNEVAKALATEGAPEGTLVLAEEQTAGRGRRGRSWVAPPGTCLLMSLVLRPSLPPPKVPQLTMLASLAVAYAVEATTGLSAWFKWPNDILVGGKKTGGVLTEVSFTGETLEYAVVGVGLNVNLDVRCIPEITDTATSLSMELGREISRLELLQNFLQHMEIKYLRLKHGESVCEEWAARLTTLGQKIKVTTPWGEEWGYAERVDRDGALIVRRDNGTEAYITVGDVQ